jgi:hypothetical protein
MLLFPRVLTAHLGQMGDRVGRKVWQPWSESQTPGPFGLKSLRAGAQTLAAQSTCRCLSKAAAGHCSSTKVTMSSHS